MTSKDNIQLYEDKKVRTAWDEEKECWWFSVVDVVGILTESAAPNAYWRKLKQRLKEEGNETVTNCHRLKMKVADGKTNYEIVRGRLRMSSFLFLLHHFLER